MIRASIQVSKVI